MNITLVTGGKGLIGKGLDMAVALDPIIDEQFFFLSTSDGDLTNYLEVKKIFSRYKPTKVIHLAANVGGLFKNMNNKIQMFEENMKMTENVLKCALEHKVKKCISCLSTCIFPDNVEYPLDETVLHNGVPHASNFGYSMAKRHIDITNRVYNSVQSSTLFTSIIPCNVYGPYDNFNLADAHVVPALIHRAYLAKHYGEPFVVLGSGAPLRQFIYSIDLGKILLKIHRDYESTDPLIIAPDENCEVSINHLAELIAKSFGLSESIKFDTSCADGQFKKTALNTKLKIFDPHIKFTPIEQGIDETAKWFETNYDSARK